MGGIIFNPLLKESGLQFLSAFLSRLPLIPQADTRSCSARQRLDWDTAPENTTALAELPLGNTAQNSSCNKKEGQFISFKEEKWIYGSVPLTCYKTMYSAPMNFITKSI